MKFEWLASKFEEDFFPSETLIAVRKSVRHALFSYTLTISISLAPTL